MAATSASPAAAAAVTIKAIDATAVHRIQSGQVIVNLCSVAKELVENSLDAGATSIEIRFKNQGLDAIEVQDNGSGIAPHNYASLALKHYTSKLTTYDDLDTLQTFGFRGEALSSLCALSRFSVTTCLASDVPKGTKLEFETSGKLGTTSVVAAQKGTTVCVENLFWNLPVRRRELERNIKREWTKVIGLLNQYACIQTGVKFTVSQQPSKGKKVVLFSTKGNAATRDNIINVFGAKTMGALLALDLTLEMATTRPSVTAAGSGGGTHEIKVLGYVSRPAHGQGRQTPDRQMFYVNGRPCKLPQFAQLFGEVYRSYNSGQSPFIFADIQLDTHLYDVNVSPDKQTILLHDQGRMLDTLRESLIELFEKQDITVPISQLASQKLTAFKKAVSATPSTPSRPTTNGRQGSATHASPPAAKSAIRSAVDEGISEDDEDDEPMGKQPSGAPSQDTGAVPGDGPDEPPEDKDETSPSQPPLQESRNSTSNLVVYPVPSKRPADDTAAVTVDDTTTTTITLSPIRKRPKINANITSRSSRATSSSMGAKVQKKKPSKPLPSFGGRLTQMFSAARRLSQDEDDEELVDDDEEADEDGEIDEDEVISEDDEDRTSQEESADDHGHTNDEEDLSEAEDAEAEVDGEDIEEDLDQDMFVDRGDNQELDDAEVDDDHMPSSMEDIQANDARDNREPMDEDDVRQTIKDEEETHVEEEEAANEDEDLDEDDMEQDPQITRTAPTADAREYTDEEKRHGLFLKQGGSKKRHETLQLVQVLKANEGLIKKQALSWQATTLEDNGESNKDKEDDDDDDGEYRPDTTGGLDDTEAVAEAKLALTIVKSDFAKMRIIGQFNLGFILAVREASRQGDDDANSEDGESAPKLDDELFIIDQHASDEKYNFERLQASTVVQSQRLVQPKKLELTAVEEEIVLEHLPALAANGFVVDAVLDGSEPVGSRCRLRTLPLSRETTFDLTDLEELIALLGDHSDSHDHHAHEGVSGSQLTAVPRPAKVRKMFAMRACRSSIMIGKALSRRQMASVLAHMGEMDKPWNCPHGRPTMRHLCSLGAAWDKTGRTWGGGGADNDNNGDGQPVRNAEWAKFLKKRRRATNKA